MATNWIVRQAPRAGIAMLAIAVGLGGCTQESAAPTGEAAEEADLVQVVATSSVICDLTQQIAQDSLQLTCLLEPGQDPHTYQAKPSDRQALEGADLILYGGYDAIPSLYSVIAATSNPGPQVAVYEAAVPEPLMVAAHDHDHGHEDAAAEDHDHDHDHDQEPAEETAAAEASEAPVPDPHVWHSAANGAAMVDEIVTYLGQMNPAAAETYRNSADQLIEEFEALHQWIAQQVETVPAEHRELITPHAAFNYYADAYNLRVKGTLSGISTEAQPTAAELTKLVDRIKAAEVPAIFAETTTSTDVIQTIARDANVKVAESPLYVEGPAGPGSDAPTLQAMLIANTCTIVNALGGTCAPDTAPTAAL